MAHSAHHRGLLPPTAAGLVGIVAVAAGVMAGGCGSTARVVEPPRRVAAPIETAAPIVAGAQRGFELYSWLAEDRDGSVDRVIAELGLTPMAAEGAGGLAGWGGSGLVVYRIRTADLDGLIGGLPALSGLQRRWLGERAAWTELVRGREEGGPRLVRVAGGGEGAEGGVVRLDGAPVRLISRGWVEPAREGAVLSLELAVQVVERSRAGGELFRAAGASRTVADEGWVPVGMSGSARLRDGEVLLIVAGARGDASGEATPVGGGDGEDGAGVGAGGVEDERATLDAMLAAMGGAGGDEAYGPSGVQTQPIGVAAFTGRTARGTTVRTVVAVIARTPVRYTIPGR